MHNDGETYTVTVTGTNEGGNFENLDTTTNGKATVTVTDTKDTTTVTIEPIVTSLNTIDMTNMNNTARGYEVKAYSSYTNYANKTEGVISTVGNATAFGNAVRGFGVEGNDASNGDERELGKGEAIVIDFKAKDILSVDVSLAWRNQDEKAEITFLDKNGNKVGSASLTGGKNGNLEATSIITYKDASGHQIGNPITIQGGSDGIDKPFELKLPNGQLFNKVVFTAPGTNDDYLINSIQYKEVVVDNSSSVITGNGEVVFKISTSNIPDPSEYNDANPPKAKVEIQISGSSEIITKEVTLDREGKGTVLVQADGTKTITAKVTEIIGGNFEAVDYSSAKSTITVGTTNPTAGNDKIDVVEDTAYTLQISDFGNTQTDVAKIQFKDLPSIDSGKLYILNSLVTSSTNERADYTQTDSGKVFVAVNVDDIVDITQIQQGNVIFVPKENSDEDGSFKFIVGDGNGKWSTPYNTEIIVKAVADAPTVSIDVTKIEISNTGTGQIVTMRNPDNFKQVLNGSDNSGKPNAGHKVEIFSNKTTNSVSISVEIGNPNQLSGVVRFFDSNGNHLNGQDVLINKSTVPNKSGNKTYKGTFSPADGSSFSSFEVANIEKGSAFHLVGYEYDISGDIADSNEYSFYKVDISSHLTDTDGSETLSVVIKNVPEGAILESTKYDVSKNSDGYWSVNFKAGTTGDDLLKISDSLTMKVPQDYTDVDLKIEATSIEERDNSSSTTTGTEDSISFAGAGDIDLSNLKNIVSLKEINLDNEQVNKLSLTLDDVLKLSGDDGKIKITGDEFDSVVFKDTKDSNGVSQSWSKTAGEGEDTGFDIYVNSGDPTLQVKVEQPISDSITN